MNLHDVLSRIIQDTLAACQLTDLRVGEVTGVAPLQVTLDTQAQPLQAAQLLLTEPVIEKKIPVLLHAHQVEGLAHSHTVSGLGHAHSTGGLGHTHTVSGLGHTHSIPGGEGQPPGVTGTALDGDCGTGDGLTGSYPSDQQLAGSYPTSSALGGAASNGALGDVACLENGIPLPVEGGYIILNRGLAVEDKVLLLRVERGQRFLILSRIFEEV